MADRSTTVGTRRDEVGGKVKVEEKSWATHCHILGRSGMGKSWLLRHMLATDIKNNDRHNGAGKIEVKILSIFP